MKLLRFTLIALALGFASQAKAAFYTTLSGLYADSSDVKTDSSSAFKTSLKNNTGLSVAVGYKFTMIRAEAEVQYFKGGFGGGSSSTGAVATSGDSKQYSGFVNGFVDLPSFLGLAPYVGGGVGLAEVDLNNLSATQGTTNVARYSGKDSVFGYQVMAGLQYHFLGHATIHAGYRYSKKGDLQLRDTVANARQNVKLSANNIFELGVSLGF